MDWNWNAKGCEEDKSGTLILKLSNETFSLEIASFSEAFVLVQCIEKLTLEAERRGADMVIDKVEKVSKQIRQSY